MNVLIIGGSGHVSNAVVPAALAADHAVWILTRGKRALPDGVTALIADRHDTEATEAAITSAECSWDLVVDCIAYETADIEQDVALFRQRTHQFVVVSSDFVFDPAQRCFPQREDGVTLADDRGGLQAYGYQKRQCELLLAASDTGDMAWTIVRPCHIYGPTSELGCLPLHSRDPQLTARLRAAEPIRLVGGGHFLQQPILARDLAEIILSVGGNAAAAGQIYNTAGPDIIESRTYYEIIADILGTGIVVEEVSVQRYLDEHPEQAPFMCHRIYDMAALRASKLAVPATSIEDSLREHVRGLLAREEAS